MTSEKRGLRTPNAIPLLELISPSRTLHCRLQFAARGFQVLLHNQSGQQCRRMHPVGSWSSAAVLQDNWSSAAVLQGS